MRIGRETLREFLRGFFLFWSFLSIWFYIIAKAIQAFVQGDLVIGALLLGGAVAVAISIAIA